MSIELSIIIPHFNSPVLLKKLIDSIDLNHNLEVIIVDDYSNQNIYLELKEYFSQSKYKNITFLQNYSLKSAGECRNIGMSISTGRWLLFADADDFFFPNMYKTVSKFFDSKNDIVYFLPTSMYLDTNNLAQRHIHDERLISDFLNNNTSENSLKLRTKFLEPWSKLFNASFIKDNDVYFDATPIANDAFFSVKSGVLAKKINVSSDIIYCVTKSKGSISTIVTKDRFEIRFTVFLKQVVYLKNNLSENEFSCLKLDGKAWIITSILNKFGIKYTFSIFSQLRKNHIDVINLKNITPKKFLSFLNFWKVEKKYMNKEN